MFKIQDIKQLLDRATETRDDVKYKFFYRGKSQKYGFFQRMFGSGLIAENNNLRTKYLASLVSAEEAGVHGLRLFHENERMKAVLPAGHPESEMMRVVGDINARHKKQIGKLNDQISALQRALDKQTADWTSFLKDRA